MESAYKPVIILGAGGHAKVIVETLVQLGRDILGFITPDKKFGDQFCGFSVLGDDSCINTFSPDDIVLVNGIGVLPRNSQRWVVAKKMRKQGYMFSTLIHPSAVIASDVELSEGVQIMAGSVLQPGVRIGVDSIINTGVLIDHDCSIAENCHLAPGVVCSGSVDVGSGSHVGTGVSVIQSISIGKNSVVAAGSVVYKDIPSNVVFKQARQEYFDIKND